MSNYVQKDNSGSTFPNDKRGNEARPDMSGKCMIDGKMFYMSSWAKKKEGGGVWWSHSFKPVEQQPARVVERDYSNEIF